MIKFMKTQRLNRLYRELIGLQDGMLKANIEFEIFLILST